MAGQAQTGTGKTAAFLLVILERLLASQPPPASDRSHPRALIVAPTRELAVQIHNDTLLLARHTGFRVGLVFGGTGYQQQRDDLAAGVDILIGTPGRLIDYFKQHVFSLKGVEVVVLDEADRMFDLGFIKDIRFLLRRMPRPGGASGHAVLRDPVLPGPGTGLRAHEPAPTGQDRVRPRSPPIGCARSAT